MWGGDSNLFDYEVESFGSTSRDPVNDMRKHLLPARAAVKGIPLVTLRAPSTHPS